MTSMVSRSLKRVPKQEQPWRGFIYELLLEILDPKAYRAFVQSKLILEAEQAAAIAKAELASTIFLKNVDQINNKITKGEYEDET